MFFFRFFLAFCIACFSYGAHAYTQKLDLSQIGKSSIEFTLENGETYKSQSIVLIGHPVKLIFQSEKEIVKIEYQIIESENIQDEFNITGKIWIAENKDWSFLEKFSMSIKPESPTSIEINSEEKQILNLKFIFSEKVEEKIMKNIEGKHNLDCPKDFDDLIKIEEAQSDHDIPCCSLQCGRFFFRCCGAVWCCIPPGTYSSETDEPDLDCCCAP